MSDENPAHAVQLPDATGAPGGREAVEVSAEPPHEAIVSQAAELKNERMHLAAKPNKGQPLSHRNRAKAGRKG